MGFKIDFPTCWMSFLEYALDYSMHLSLWKHLHSLRINFKKNICWGNSADSPIPTFDRSDKHDLSTINQLADWQSAILSHQQTPTMTIQLVSDWWLSAYQSYRSMVIRTSTTTNIRLTYFDYRHIVNLSKIASIKST